MKTDAIETLKQETRGAILAYNMNRVQLVHAAAQKGDGKTVAQLEDEFTALCNADFSLTRTKLNENHRQYQKLMDEATDCAGLLKKSIIETQTIADVLDKMAKTVTLIGRILLMLAA